MLPSNKPVPSSFLPTLLEKKSSGVDTYPMPCLDEVVKILNINPYKSLVWKACYLATYLLSFLSQQTLQTSNNFDANFSGIVFNPKPSN
jgi:hypothetical protein